MGGFELQNPRGLILLAGAVPIVLFYILKIQRRRQRVPSTLLWSAAQRDLLAKQPFRRLVAELPLILQLLALAVLALALARPATRGSGITGDHIAIVIDTSASMGARSRGMRGSPAPGTRMAEARAAALDVIAGLAPGADAIVIEAARDPRVVSPLERDARHLRAAVGSLAVRDVEGDLAPAVALAADRIRALSGKRRVVVITDGAPARDAPLVASGLDTQVVMVGDAEENAAIVRVDVRAGVDPATRRDQVQAFVMLRNYADKPRDAFVTLTVEGSAEPTASRRVLLAAGEKMPVVLTFEPSAVEQGNGLVVQLAPGDALAIDDVAFGRVPAGRRMPVTLASGATYSWVARALEADAELDLQRVTVAELGTVNVDPDALVIVEGACPRSPPGHDVLIVAPPTGACMGVDVGAPIEQPQLTSWETGDPRFRFLTLDGVHVARSARLASDGIAAGLVRAGDTTLIADASVPGRTVTILGFDPGESDWPLKASFVLFVRNVLEIARLHRDQGAVAPVRTGEPLRVVVPGFVRTIRVDGPGMPEHDVTAKAGFAIVPAVERAGFYHVRWTEPHVGGALVAANLASERESDIRPRPVIIDSGAGLATSTTGGRVADAHNEYNSWLALVAALIIAFDAWWLTRGPRPRTNLAGGRS
jgi:hypothetical protein